MSLTLVLALLFAVVTPSVITSPANAASTTPIYGKARLVVSKDLQSLTFISTSVKVNGKQYKLASDKAITMHLF